MSVTLTGALGSSAYSLAYDLRDAAYSQAQALIADVDLLYQSAVQYGVNHGYAHTGALIIGDAVAQHHINAVGFGAVIDQNNSSRSTILGGNAGGYQVVLAGNGGLTYAYVAPGAGNVTVDAGGGNNKIDLKRDAANAVVYTGDGNDTIYASQGSVSIAAGAGSNLIRLGAGADFDRVTGQDKIFLGSGTANIQVAGNGSADVFGASVVSGTGYSLTFIGGSAASTVHAGAGSYSIAGGAGGGVFYGASGGNNVITGGSGDVTIYGGGSGDHLTGGSGNNQIIAGLGNETLNGGTGSSERLTLLTDRTGGTGTTDTIVDFAPGRDIIELNGGAGNAYALQTYEVVNGSGTFYLLDGTKVVLEGYTGPLTRSDLRS
jgi:Ca2+-binding RTX toxin-like protein